MNILVTGGAGYIGSLLIEKLLTDGHNVRVLDILRFKQNSLDQFCYNDRFEFIYGDVKCEKTLITALDDVDVIFPLACLVGAPLCDKFPEEAQAVNLESIRTLVKHVKYNQKIIYPTTNSGYGTKSGEEFCTEETPLDPISLYGRTKVEAEEVLLASNKAVTLRLATVFGTSYRTRFDLMVNDFVYRAVKEKKLVIYEGHFKRNFIHIRDVIDCFIFIIDNFEKLRGEAFNLGLDSANISKLELANMIKSEYSDVDISCDEYAIDPDKRNYIVSNKKLADRGFVAKRDLRSGIREMIKASQMTIVRETNI